MPPKKTAAKKEAVTEEKKEKKEKTGGPGRSRAYPLDAKITVLSTSNPKRKGSGSYDRFELYKSGMTVKNFLDKGGKTADLTWDTRKGFIEVA